jgi:hypothetical protein
MTTYKLVKYSADWADEFDCKGFGLFKNDEWDKLCRKVEKALEDCSLAETPFGTNESLQFDSYRAWRKCFEETDISEQEYNFLKKNFGDPFGTGSSIFDICGFI